MLADSRTTTTRRPQRNEALVNLEAHTGSFSVLFVVNTKTTLHKFMYFLGYNTSAEFDQFNSRCSARQAAWYAQPRVFCIACVNARYECSQLANECVGLNGRTHAQLTCF